MFEQLMDFFYKQKEINEKMPRPSFKSRIDNITDATILPSLNDIDIKKIISDMEGCENVDIENFDHVVLDINNLNTANLDNAPEEIKNMVKMLKGLKATGQLDDMTPDEIDEIVNAEMDKAFGTPKDAEEIKMDGKTISRRVYTRKNLSELESLEMGLKRALDAEDYEAAGVLRDEITKLKNQDGLNGSGRR